MAVHHDETYDALVLRLRAAGCVFAEEEAAQLLEAATSRPPTGPSLEDLVERRVAGEPLEHVVGWVDFAGVRVGLEADVFIPRQRTAFLVELAVGALVSRLAEMWVEEARNEPSRNLAPQPAAGPPAPQAQPAAVVVDLCCGSGAVGLALAHRHPGLELHAADVDPVAVACARRNLGPVGATAHQGDLDAPLPERLRCRVDVLVANAPYVPSAAIALMPPESRDHEPRDTVDGGADGLDVVRRLAALAPRWLAPGGTVLVEIGADQALPAAAAFETAGLIATVHHDDDRGATAVAARREGP